MRRENFLASAMLALAVAIPAAAYAPAALEFNGQIVVPTWAPGNLPLRFKINDRPLPQLTNFLTNSMPSTAIDNSIRSWSAGTGLGIRNDGTTAILSSAGDGINLISFADTPQNRDATSNSLGTTLVRFRLDQGAVRLSDTDIILNPRERWATDGRAGILDAEETIVHEMGHALGLDHSGLLAATMYPTGREGSILQRSLEADDLAGVRFLYPSLGAGNTGVITGRVTTTDNRSVLGAHVVALDVRGIAPVGAFSLADGSFRVTSLPPGDYKLYVEPLDGPVFLKDIGETFVAGLARFRSAYAGGNATPATYKVAAGQSAFAGQIKVEANTPTFNPLMLGLVNAEGRAPFFFQSVAVRAGSEGVLLVAGEGLGGVPDEGVRITGGDITLDTSNVERGTVEGLAYAFYPFFVAPGAAPGPRSITFSSAAERAVLSGALEISP